MTKFSTLLKYFDNAQDIADFMLAEIQAEIDNELVEQNREDDDVAEGGM